MRGIEGSSSFLQKRTKKLLQISRLGAPPHTSMSKVFASFFKKKCFFTADPVQARRD
jgi:hypothetical protein